jgi:hypothetical protein
MKLQVFYRKHPAGLIFGLVFLACLGLGGLISQARPVVAAPAEQGTQPQSYAGSSACATCHEDLHTEWMTTRHAQAFSAPIFQRDWTELGNQTACLECHTTGFNPVNGSYAEEGVTCESCHGPFQPDHPEEPMPFTPNAELCSQCHKGTVDEWLASPHSAGGVQCQSCHNAHSQTPKADSVTGLCSNCHKERGDSFTHSTHSESGLECSNCHMYTSPRTDDPIMGLVPTGHTFSVGSDACVGCHQDTVHTRNEIVKLTSELETAGTVDTASLEQQIAEQEEDLANLETQNASRLYLGLVQGAIVGLVTGGAAAWVVSRGVRIVEVKEDESK